MECSSETFISPINQHSKVTHTIWRCTFANKVVILQAVVVIPSPPLIFRRVIHKLHAILVLAVVVVVGLSRWPVLIGHQPPRCEPREGAFIGQITAADPECAELFLKLIRSLNEPPQGTVFCKRLYRCHLHAHRMAFLSRLEPVGLYRKQKLLWQLEINLGLN